jgi:hypothetical protein
MSESNILHRFVVAKEKQCCACREVKPASEFHRSNHHSGGLVAKCKICIKIYKDTQWKNRKDCQDRGIAAQRAREREFREKDPVGFLEWQRAKNKKYWDKHGDRVKNSPKFKLNNRISCAVWRAMRGQGIPSYWQDVFPYTVDDLKNRLMETMPEGYGWDDVLSGKLHIDHIVPKCAFEYESADDEGFKVCWELKNLQLLTEADNKKKNASIPDWFEKVFEEDESPSIPASDSEMVSTEVSPNTKSVLE